MKRILVALILIPSLLATPPSVAKLMARPIYGPAVIRLNDGSQVEGSTVRVTNEFIAMRKDKVCSLIPVSDIREFTWKKVSDEEWPIWFVIVYAVIVSPVVVPMLPVTGVVALHHALKDDTQPRTYREWQADNGLVLALWADRAEHIKLSRTTGNYRTNQGILTLDGLKEFYLDYECDQLHMVGDNRTETLSSMYSARAAAGPIIGTWRIAPYTQRDVWEFRPDGTYEITRFVSHETGQARYAGGKITITWADGQESSVVAKHNVLSVATNGVTEQYSQSKR